jgi:hypothetical protein
VGYRCKRTQHLSRMNEVRILTVDYEYTMTSRRNVGQQRKRWAEQQWSRNKPRMAYTLLLIRPTTKTRRLLAAKLRYFVLQRSCISLSVAGRIKILYLKHQCFESCGDIGWLGNTDVTIRLRSVYSGVFDCKCWPHLCVNEGKLSSVVCLSGVTSNQYYKHSKPNVLVTIL